MATHAAPLLITFLSRSAAEPSAGIACPRELAAELDENDLMVDRDTVTDGQCGLHAFLISLEEVRKRFTFLYGLGIAKRLSRQRTLAAKLEFLRANAVTWIKDSAGADLWPGTTVKAYVLATQPATFGEYLCRMSGTNCWIDACMMHALGMLFKVDVLIFQHGAPISFVGMSQTADSGASVPFVPVALCNDRHWWGLIPRGPVLGSTGHSPTLLDVRNDAVDAVDDDEIIGDGYLHVNLAPARQPAAVEAELNLCMALRDWSPWDAPSDDLVKTMSAATGCNAGSALSPALLCSRRQAAVADLMADENDRDFPADLSTHAVARYRLMSANQRFPSKTHATADLGDIELGVRLDSCKEAIVRTCHEHRLACHCKSCFAEFPHVVQNWRLMWMSLPRPQRREAVLHMYKKSLMDRLDVSLKGMHASMDHVECYHVDFKGIWPGAMRGAFVYGAFVF